MEFPVILKNKYRNGTVYSYPFTDFPAYIREYYPEVVRQLIRDVVGDVIGVKVAQARSSIWGTLCNISIIAMENEIVVVNCNDCMLRVMLLFNKKVYGRNIAMSSVLSVVCSDNDQWEKFETTLEPRGMIRIGLD